MTGAAALITALAGLLVAAAAVGTLVMLIRNSRATTANGHAIQEVHVLVDGRMTAMEDRVAQLTAALEGSDTDVPPAPRIVPSGTAGSVRTTAGPHERESTE